jgi:hypothetical protein
MDILTAYLDKVGRVLHLELGASNNNSSEETFFPDDQFLMSFLEEASYFCGPLCV